VAGPAAARAPEKLALVVKGKEYVVQPGLHFVR
jgi:hypothetical protein